MALEKGVKFIGINVFLLSFLSCCVPADFDSKGNYIIPGPPIEKKKVRTQYKLSFLLTKEVGCDVVIYDRKEIVENMEFLYVGNCVFLNYRKVKNPNGKFVIGCPYDFQARYLISDEKFKVIRFRVSESGYGFFRSKKVTTEKEVCISGIGSENTWFYHKD